MSDLKIKGIIKTILPVESGTSKAGKEWKKQQFVINTGNEFNPDVCFQIFGGERCDKFTQFNKVGDIVEVSFNLSSREFNGKYYHNLDAWKVWSDKGTNEATQYAQTESVAGSGQPADDLPF